MTWVKNNKYVEQGHQTHWKDRNACHRQSRWYSDPFGSKVFLVSIGVGLKHQYSNKRRKEVNNLEGKVLYFHEE